MKKHKEDMDMDGMKRGGKAAKMKLKRGGKAIKVEGANPKERMDKIPRKAGGGAVQDSTDSGVSPSNPLSKNAMKRGGKAK
jgi:hypothetical protein